MSDLGIVVIGRNEARRLHRCLQSVVDLGYPVIYVDSGSSDDSVRIARSLGVRALELDDSAPFTAARGRNEGLTQLLKWHPHLQYVQFVDGDCQLAAGWLDAGLKALQDRRQVAAVCGRLRERDPRATVYNVLSELEWDQAPGEILSCGGIAMMRVEAVRSVGGFRREIAAGEEPELCFRFRRHGWRIWREGAEMAVHESDTTRFADWWTRSVRAGFAYSEGAWLHAFSSSERFNLRCVASSLWWGCGLPVLAAGLWWPTRGVSAYLLLLYVIQWVRMLRHQQRRGRSLQASMLYASFTLLAKLAMFVGEVGFLWRKLSRRQAETLKRPEAISPPRPCRLDSAGQIAQ